MLLWVHEGLYNHPAQWDLWLVATGCYGVHHGSFGSQMPRLFPLNCTLPFNSFPNACSGSLGILGVGWHVSWCCMILSLTLLSLLTLKSCFSLFCLLYRLYSNSIGSWWMRFARSEFLFQHPLFQQGGLLLSNEGRGWQRQKYELDLYLGLYSYSRLSWFGEFDRVLETRLIVGVTLQTTRATCSSFYSTGSDSSCLGLLGESSKVVMPPKAPVPPKASSKGFPIQQWEFKDYKLTSCTLDIGRMTCDGLGMRRESDDPEKEVMDLLSECLKPSADKWDKTGEMRLKWHIDEGVTLLTIDKAKCPRIAMNCSKPVDGFPNACSGSFAVKDRVFLLGFVQLHQTTEWGPSLSGHRDAAGGGQECLQYHGGVVISYTGACLGLRGDEAKLPFPDEIDWEATEPLEPPEMAEMPRPFRDPPSTSTLTVTTVTETSTTFTTKTSTSLMDVPPNPEDQDKDSKPSPGEPKPSESKSTPWPFLKIVALGLMLLAAAAAYFFFGTEGGKSPKQPPCRPRRWRSKRYGELELPHGMIILWHDFRGANLIVWWRLRTEFQGHCVCVLLRISCCSCSVVKIPLCKSCRKTSQGLRCFTVYMRPHTGNNPAKSWGLINHDCDHSRKGTLKRWPGRVVPGLGTDSSIHFNTVAGEVCVRISKISKFDQLSCRDKIW